MIKDIEKKASEKMNKTIESLTNDLATLKAGRANPKILDRIEVAAYGGMSRLIELGNVSPDAVAGNFLPEMDGARVSDYIDSQLYWPQKRGGQSA